MHFKIFDQLTNVLKIAKDLIWEGVKTEFSSDAGKTNLIFGIMLFIILLILLVPDYAFSLINILLSTLKIPNIPPIVPQEFVIVFLILVLLFFWWCVWYVGNLQKGKTLWIKS